MTCTLAVTYTHFHALSHTTERGKHKQYVDTHNVDDKHQHEKKRQQSPRILKHKKQRSTQMKEKVKIKKKKRAKNKRLNKQRARVRGIRATVREQTEAGERLCVVLWCLVLSRVVLCCCWMVNYSKRIITV